MKFIKKLNKRSQKAILSILVILLLAIILKSLLPDTFESLTNAPFNFKISFKSDIIDINPGDLDFYYSTISTPQSQIKGETVLNGSDSTISFPTTVKPTTDYYITITTRNTDLAKLLIDQALVVTDKTPVIPARTDGITVQMGVGESTLELKDAD